MMSYCTFVIDDKGDENEDIFKRICETYQTDFFFKHFKLNPLDFDDDIFLQLNKLAIETIIQKLETEKINCFTERGQSDELRKLMVERLKDVYGKIDFEKDDVVLWIEIVPGSLVKQYHKEKKISM